MLSRLFILCLMIISSLSLSACSIGADIEIESSSSNITQSEDQISESEEVLTQSKGELEDTASTSNMSKEEQQIIKDKMINIINNSDKVEVVDNLILTLKDEDKLEIINILNLEEKEVISSDNSFGAFGIKLLTDNSDDYMLFTSVSESEYIIIIDAIYRVYLDEDTVNAVSDFFFNLGDESIKNGNEKLEEDVFNILKNLALEDIIYSYEVSPEQIKELSSEEIQSIKDVLSINDWRIYTGNYSLIHPYKEDSITFTNQVDIGSGYIFNQTINFAHYDGVYVAKIVYLDGPGMQLELYITQEIYDNLKSEISKILGE